MCKRSILASGDTGRGPVALARRRTRADSFDAAAAADGDGEDGGEGGGEGEGGAGAGGLGEVLAHNDGGIEGRWGAANAMNAGGLRGGGGLLAAIARRVNRLEGRAFWAVIALMMCLSAAGFVAFVVLLGKRSAGVFPDPHTLGDQQSGGSASEFPTQG